MIVKLLQRGYDFISSQSYRKVVAARVLDYLLRRLNPNIKYFGLENEDGLILLPTGESVVTPYAIADNGFQKSDVYKSIELAEKHGYQMGGVFLDVGAHIGTSAVYAIGSRKFREAFCFEPVPDNLKNLELNIRVNHLESQIKSIPSAVGRENLKFRMSLSGSNTGDNRLLAESQGLPQGHLTTIEVDCTTLDSFLDCHTLTAADLSFVWMDTQGYEGYVLAGATSVVAQSIPICMEFWPWALKSSENFDVLISSIGQNYAVFYDMRNLELGALPVSKLTEYSQKFTGDQDHTDLLLLGQPPEYP